MIITIVIYCYATGDVTGRDWYTGGLVGLAGGDESIIRNATTGNVAGVSGVGESGWSGTYNYRLLWVGDGRRW